jgi:excisionase family DNA binding protein
MGKRTRQIQFPQWLSKREAAKYLGISPRTLDYWTAQTPPRVGYVKLGKEKRFILTDLQRFTEEHTVKAA